MEGGKSKGIQNDTNTQGSYTFREVRKSRSVLFGKEDLIWDFNEIRETLKGPRERHAAMVFELVSKASSMGHKKPDNETFQVEISYTKSKIQKIAITANSLNTLKMKAKHFGK